ncbi:MAG: sigma-70 family RNA polymerase sigma factor [Phycisphaerae bacterium]|jgi:RNA polymerase sigma factor (sigma-70 family)
MSHADTTRLSFLLRLRDRADKLSWHEFHDRYGQLLYRYARARGASHDDAEDIVQEVEMYLFKAMDGLEYDGSRGRFRTYLHSAVSHALARGASKQARQPTGLDPQAFDVITSQRAERADEQWEQEWQLHRLRWALRAIADTFEPATLKAFEMHVLGGRSAVETADLLGVTKWCVYQAKSRVLRCLRERLAAEDPDGNV